MRTQHTFRPTVVNQLEDRVVLNNGTGVGLGSNPLLFAYVNQLDQSALNSFPGRLSLGDLENRYHAAGSIFQQLGHNNLANIYFGRAEALQNLSHNNGFLNNGASREQQRLAAGLPSRGPARK